MKHVDKYERMYFMPPKVTYEWVKKDHLDAAPIWCSVDLRDGNQALIEPMGLDEKLEYFQMLVNIGFKEIEVGFPASSETEYQFVRTLIEKKMIPSDVTIQVLTQARDHIIRKTFEAIDGAPHAVVHLYNSTSVAQREQVFKKSKEEIKRIAVEGAKLLKQLAKEAKGDFSFEYSPESFPGTEVDYAAEVCNAVLEVWKPVQNHKAIINLPTTVENAMPHVFASQVEYMSKHLKYREAVILSLHPHNDRGSSISDAELGVLAGADRVEGTLFGNGERTGNLDLVTMAMNLYSHGVNPGLNFSNMPEICAAYERLTGMQVGMRQPYAGELVFTAFSGSHQDAIAKGMNYREEKQHKIWNVPYLPIDPADVGREYGSDVIRINSQSGKGGVSYILKQNFGLSLPEKMKEQVGYAVKHVSDIEHKELSPEWVHQIFLEEYVNRDDLFQILEYHFKKEDGIQATVSIKHAGNLKAVTGEGNGRLDAVSNALKQYFGIYYDLTHYEEHSLSEGSSSKAVTYVGISFQDQVYWGVGIAEDIIHSSVCALVSAVNRLEQVNDMQEGGKERLTEILSYIQTNYRHVTLDELAKQFFLSKPYISKFIKEKSGLTFGDHVKIIRLKRAEVMLKNAEVNIETVAEAVGYQNAEHFIRLFKKQYGMTPVQYRNRKS